MVRVEKDKLFVDLVIDKLSQLGFKDGSNLQNTDIHSGDVTIWNKIMENTKASKNKSYITYNLSVYGRNSYGDGRELMTKKSISIDLFSMYRLNSKELYNMRKSIEEEFSKDLWRIELNLEEYDATSKLNHISYKVENYV